MRRWWVIEEPSGRICSTHARRWPVAAFAVWYANRLLAALDYDESEMRYVIERCDGSSRWHTAEARWLEANGDVPGGGFFDLPWEEQRLWFEVKK